MRNEPRLGLAGTMPRKEELAIHGVQRSWCTCHYSWLKVQLQVLVSVLMVVKAVSHHLCKASDSHASNHLSLYSVLGFIHSQTGTFISLASPSPFFIFEKKFLSTFLCSCLVCTFVLFSQIYYSDSTKAPRSPPHRFPIIAVLFYKHKKVLYV